MVRLMEHRAANRTVDSHWDIAAKNLLTNINRFFADKENVRYCPGLVWYSFATCFRFFFLSVVIGRLVFVFLFIFSS